MNIIVTASFEKHRKKFWSKSQVRVSLLKDILLQDISQGLLYIHRPYIKVKFRYHQKSCRLLVAYNEDKNILLPLFLTDKNDTLYWYNMVWNKQLEQKIDLLMMKAIEDLDMKKFTLLS